MKRLTVILALLSSAAFGQAINSLNGVPYAGKGSSVPSTCGASGVMFYKTSATAGWYYCNGGTYSAFGAGSGTVTSFSAGTLSPLFTTSVATSTSTPALSFTLSSAAANTVLGNATGSSAAPTFTASPSLTSVIVNGATSGSATLSASATGGTLNLGSTNATVSSAGALTVVSCTGCGGATTETHSASTSATLDFTTCPSGANNFRINVSELIPATDQADVQFLVSTNGGSSYDNTAAHYSQADGYHTQGNSGQGGTTQALINLTDTASQGVKAIASTGYSGSFTFFNPASSSFKQMVGLASYQRGFDSSPISLTLSAFYLQTTAVNAFRIKASSGNLTSGTVSCTPLD